MQTIEFYTTLKNRTITIPENQPIHIDKPVKVIILTDDTTDTFWEYIETFRATADFEAIGNVDEIFENVRSKEIGREIDL
ncbi:hypothetical protein QUF74_11960 [Candidatus Halobeggiatoa sp. HSG11]|nr:hypothetical protein [Candidatus Halobeggiatoa sp. HSG11]